MAIAAAVIKEAIKEDLAEGYREMDARELRKLNQVLQFTEYSQTHVYLLFKKCTCIEHWA